MTHDDGPTNPELVRFLREELGQDLGADAAGGGSWYFTGPIWLWRGKAKDGVPGTMAWHFLTIDGEVAESIRAAAPGRTAAWGSVYVSATLGATEWRTSLFPSKSVGGYLLPLKAKVRKAEAAEEGNVITVQLVL